MNTVKDADTVCIIGIFLMEDAEIYNQKTKKV